MLDVEPQLAAARPGLTLITDKGFAGRVTEADLARRSGRSQPAMDHHSRAAPARERQRGVQLVVLGHLASNRQRHLGPRELRPQLRDWACQEVSGQPDVLARRSQPLHRAHDGLGRTDLNLALLRFLA
jgi:hypothetical protein